MKRLAWIAGLMMSVPATAEVKVVAVAPLAFDVADGKTTLQLFPWFTTKAGDKFTVIPLRNAPAGWTLTATKAKKLVGHCYGENVHDVTLELAEGAAAKKVQPVGKTNDGKAIMPRAIFVSPPAPKAKLLVADKVAKADLPSGYPKANLAAAADVDGDGKPDVALMRVCSGYGIRPPLKQAALDAMDHRRCPKNVPVFDHLFLRSKGKWKEVWFEDLC